MIKHEDLLRELLQTFQAEAAEHLQTLNMALLALEARPEEPRRRELVQEAFRAAHSLKGAARAVSLEDIEKLANAMENILEEARDSGQHLEASCYDGLYDALDTIGLLLEGKSVAIEPLINRLAQNRQGQTNEAAGSDSPPAETSGMESQIVSNTPRAEPLAARPPVSDEPNSMPLVVNSEETIRVGITKLDNLMAQVGELLVSRMNAEQRAAEMRAIRYQLAGWSKVSREIKILLPQVKNDAGKRLTEILLDYEEQFQAVTQDVSHFDQHLRQDSLRLRVIAAQLQENVRHVRMVPFETLVPGLQRAVRDAAHIEGKQVAFQVTGGEVELDKKVLEALKDPILHMLRNAVSHGIEAPEARQRLGKPIEGRVTLALQQRGGEVRITVRDDGAGFDVERLRRAGGIDGNELDERASQDDIIGLAFISGITTAEEVTALSGRGIGLDVVRQRVEALQGRIEVESAFGKGARIHLLVPVSLAISRGLLVRVGDERYVLPLLSIEKIVVPRQTFTVGGQTMLTVDGATVPLVALATLLERPVVNQNEQNPLAVIMPVADQRLALLVDDVLTEQEVAVKPLGKPLAHVRNVAGAALMGDGKPVVILNAADLVRSVKGMRKSLVIQHREAAHKDRHAHILVVDDSITTRTLEKNILETAGFEVTTATDGMEALRQLKERHIDLVVSDVEMPNMDGITLTRHLREINDYKDLPIILVTSLESREDRERGMVAGADAYIVKRGFDQAELLKTIQQLVFIEDA